MCAIEVMLADRLAPLLYVSPTQINCVAEFLRSYAWVSVEAGGTPYIPQGMTVPIATLALVSFRWPGWRARPGI